jgi:two-component system, cell cycle response regulator
MSNSVEQTERKAEREKLMLLKGKKIYVQELTKQVTLLEQLLLDLSKQYDLGKSKHIYLIAHTIKGSAPIFGFNRVGKMGELLVHLWGWTQEDHPAEPIEGILPTFIKCLEISKGHVVQLKMEYELSVKEIEADENGQGEKREFSEVARFRLLLIDDDDVFRLYLVQRLQMLGYQVDEAADVYTAQMKLRERKYDLITLDLLMYPKSGYELFEFLKKDPTLKWIPLIVLSGREDIQDKVRCLHLGADDYVVKPFQFEELEARIYRLLLRAKLLEQMAFCDSLTGVYNRRYFDHQLRIEMQRIQRYPSSITMAFIDIDEFKQVNDTYGHQIGDRVLQGLGHLLQQNIRQIDLLARYGGEEFVIVFPNTTADEAYRIVCKLSQKVNEKPIFENNSEKLFITFSAGIAGWHPNLPIEDWIELADSAMYQAKSLGRNRVILAGSILQVHKEQSLTASSRKKVLIADNDPMIESILKMKLESLSVDVIVAKNEAEVLRMLVSNPIDLLIVDSAILDLNNGLFVNQWESISQSKRIKLFILSSQKKEATISQSFMLEASDYMTKPFSMVEFEFCIKRLLKIEE